MQDKVTLRSQDWPLHPRKKMGNSEASLEGSRIVWYEKNGTCYKVSVKVKVEVIEIEITEGIVCILS